MKEEIQKIKETVSFRVLNIAKQNLQTVGDKNDLYITLEQLNDILMSACPCECGFQESYGFVPEADCPVHD